MLASPSPAIRIGNDSMSPAETLAVTSPVAGTLCPCCQKQFTAWLSDDNFEAHKKSKACQRKQTANPSLETNLLSAFNAPSPLPLSTTASADEFEEPSRRAEEKAANKKRQSKKAARGRKAERERERRWRKRRNG